MEKRTIEVNAKTGSAQQDLEKVVQLLSEMNGKLDDVGSSAKEGFDEMEKSAKEGRKSLLSFGNLFKAGGVFALAEKVLGFVTDAFKETQFGADLLQISQEALSRVMNDFFTFITNNVGGVVDSFKSIFNDPIQAVLDLGSAIKDNLIERFNSALEVLGYLGSAAKKFFSGDFAGALDDVKEAGKEYVDVLTGVDDSANKIVEGTKSLVESTVNYGKEIVKNATNSVKLQREAEKLEAVNQGLIESYDIQAESLRQVRDDETKSIDERIEANNKLKGVLEEQEKAMKANAQAIVDAAQARFDSTGLQEDEIALIQAKNELTAVEATVTGFMSEQLINENGLRREKLELMNELQLIGKDEFERQKSEASQLRDQRVADIEREVSDATMRKELLLAVEKEYQASLDDIDNQKNEAAEKQRQEDFAREQAITSAKIDLAGQALGALQGLAKEGSAASKAIAVGQVVLDAYKAIQATFANASANPTSILFPGYPAVMAGITAVTAFGNVKKILSVDETGKTAPSVGGSGGGRGAQPPSFNVVGTAPENQLAESIGDSEKKPVKAYVVGDDVTNQQALDRKITEGASIG